MAGVIGCAIGSKVTIAREMRLVAEWPNTVRPGAALHQQALAPCGRRGPNFGVIVDVNAADGARGVAVLLHPHPAFGGNRFHPFVDGLFRRLPDVSISAIRLDFSSADPLAARAEVMAAIDAGVAQWPGLLVVLAGYSFGAGIAAAIDDERVASWYLLAPPATMLSEATIGSDPRPKALAVPEHDQFSPPAMIAEVVAGWVATTVTTVPGADHFLGAVPPIVEGALNWITHHIAG